MARDLDLVRKIMMEISRQEDGRKILNIKIEGYSEELIQLHLALINDSEYIKAYKEEADNQTNFYPTRLTWKGYDFLALAKNDENWNKAKKIAEKAGGMTLELISKILSDIVLGMLKQP